jgi:MFS family permease
MFAYGLLSVVLALFLTALGFSEARVGLLLSLTLAGDTVVSLALTTRADRLGRRRTLVAGAALMLLAAACFAASSSFWLLLAAAIVGVISPSGNEVGPFLPVEQAALAEITPAERRTRVFARYHLLGALATACGALGAGLALRLLPLPLLARYRALVVGYGAIGLALCAGFLRLSPAVEARGDTQELARGLLGLHRSRGVVLRLSLLFALDAFAGGLVMQSLLAYYLHQRFALDPAWLGSVFFGANLLAAISALSAAWVAERIGLLNTMVFTHLPSNVLLMLVALMPNAALAVTVLLARFSISQMDVPTRQSYVMAVVAPDERSAAAGVTGVARSLGAAVAPLASAPLLGQARLASLPLYVAGGLKIVYDLALYRSFRTLRPPEERAAS